jgi:hypothetical protein
MDIREWAQRALVEAKAAFICYEHGFIVATTNVPAVNGCVASVRAHPLRGISQDGAELAVLQVYLSLPESCPGCDQVELAQD